jgi:2-oxoisovalerate dehydrogenase E2 component (dihydrolipoyl transacylase)
MATKTTFRLPDVGEGLTEAELLRWLVAVGDFVEVNDTICEIETAKSVVELPSPVAGTVHELHAAEGDTVPVGDPLATFSVRGPDAPAVAPESDPAPLVLVGTGPRAAAVRQRHITRPASKSAMVGRSPTGRARSLPMVRRRARELGVDLESLAATLPGGLVREEDLTVVPLPSDGPPVQPITERLTVDLTRGLALLRSGRRRHDDWSAVDHPLLVLTAVAFVLAARTHVGAGTEVRLRLEDPSTDQEFWPVVGGAQELTAPELARALASGHKDERDRSAQVSVTVALGHPGAVGADAGVPPLCVGDLCALSLGAARRRPWIGDAGIEERVVAEVALCYDPALSRGRQGSRLLVAVAELMEDPALVLLYR